MPNTTVELLMVVSGQPSASLGLELKCYGTCEEQLVLVPTIIGQSISSVDRRKTTIRGKPWTPEDLQEAFGEMDNQELATSFSKILKWAEDTSCFAQSVTKNPCFGISIATAGRILGVYQVDGVWAYFDASRFSNAEERSHYASQLIQAGLLDRTFHLDEQTQKKLDFSAEDAADKMIAVLEQQQAT